MARSTSASCPLHLQRPLLHQQVCTWLTAPDCTWLTAHGTVQCINWALQLVGQDACRTCLPELMPWTWLHACSMHRRALPQHTGSECAPLMLQLGLVIVLPRRVVPGLAAPWTVRPAGASVGAGHPAGVLVPDVLELERDLGPPAGQKDRDRLVELVREVAAEGHSTLVFCATRPACESCAGEPPIQPASLPRGDSATPLAPLMLHACAVEGPPAFRHLLRQA